MKNIIEVSNLSKKISSKFEMNNLSFNIKPGYVTGLIGSNGSGKTTLITLIMGLYLKDCGNIKIFDKEFEKYETQIKQSIGYVPDSPSYIDKLSLKKNTELIKMFYPKWNDDKYNSYMEKFSLDETQDFIDLSKGMKMKYSLAIALSQDPDLLILDEPTAGIDPIFRREILDMLYDFVSDNKKSVLFSTHITSDLDKIADYLILIDNGNIVLNGVKDELLAQFYVVKGDMLYCTEELKSKAISYTQNLQGFEALITKDSFSLTDKISYDKPVIEDLIYFFNKKSI